MKIVRFKFDENLIAEVDRAASLLKTTRSAFVREALANAVAKRDETQHRRGYEATPETQDEFGVWTAEQVWPK